MSNRLRSTPKISQQSPQNEWLKSQPFKDHFNDMINSKILEKEEYLIIKKL